MGGTGGHRSGCETRGGRYPDGKVPGSGFRLTPGLPVLLGKTGFEPRWRRRSRASGVPTRPVTFVPDVGDYLCRSGGLRREGAVRTDGGGRGQTTVEVTGDWTRPLPGSRTPTTGRGPSPSAGPLPRMRHTWVRCVSTTGADTVWTRVWTRCDIGTSLSRRVSRSLDDSGSTPHSRSPRRVPVSLPLPLTPRPLHGEGLVSPVSRPVSPTPTPPKLPSHSWSSRTPPPCTSRAVRTRV